MKTLILLFSLFTTLPSLAQTDRIDSLLNDLIYSDAELLVSETKKVKFDFILTGLNYNSSTFYAGREIGSDMFNISGHLYYYNASGLYIGTSGNWYDQMSPAYTNTIVSAGYRRSLDKKKRFTFRTSYSRYIYNKPDSGSYYPYKNNVNLGFSVRRKWIGGRISTNLLFGEESRINFSSAVYSRFTMVKFGKYNKVYLAPEISVYFGTETVSTITSSQTPDLITGYEEVFGLLNTQVYIPLGLSVGNFDLEVSCSGNLPTTHDDNITYPVQAYYSISLAYMLPVAR